MDNFPGLTHHERSCFRSKACACIFDLEVWCGFLVLDEIGELLEVKEMMSHSFLILLLNDEILGVHLSFSQFLFLILTHQLGQSAVELAHIMGKELSVAKDLHQKLLLIFFPNEATLNAKALISNLFPTIIEYFLGPNASLLLLFEQFDFLISLLE